MRNFNQDFDDMDKTVKRLIGDAEKIAGDKVSPRSWEDMVYPAERKFIVIPVTQGHPGVILQINGKGIKGMTVALSPEQARELARYLTTIAEEQS